MAAATSMKETGLEDWLRQQEAKELLRFVTIGSVDDGKSTLIGRLLHDAHGLYQDQLDAVRRASAKGSTRGAGSISEIDFSLFTDGLLAEREQGITIDVAYRYFATDRRKFIIADTPGHVQYTRNMATGASTADVAIILIDARLGVIAQTRRHLHIAALLGIPHVIACVNKMDLIGFDKARFDEIVGVLSGVAQTLGVKHLHPIPVSALEGDNVVHGSARSEADWWNGGTLLSLLETLDVGFESKKEESAFRFPVQLVLRPGLGYRGFAGQIVSGSIAVGDEVLVLPSGKRSKVIGVDVAGEDIGRAFAPMSIALRLADEIDISRGDMLVRASESTAKLPTTTSELEAHLVWMSERPLDPTKTYVVKQTTRSVRATIDVVHNTDPETLAPVPVAAAADSNRTLALNDIGRARLHCRAPLSVDPYESNRATGAFIVIDAVTNDTVAAGMVIAALAPAASSDQEAIDRAFDEARSLFNNGQSAVVVRTAEEAERATAAGFIALLPKNRGET